MKKSILIECLVSSQGSLRAHDLGGSDIARSNTGCTGNDIYSKNVKAFNYNLQGSATSATAVKATNPIYAKCMQAINRSLTFALAQEPGWILLDSDTCIHQTSHGLDFFGNFQPTKVVIFKSRWTRTGLLFIRLIATHQPQLSRIVEYLKPRDIAPIELGAPVLLVPLAFCGSFRGVLQRKSRSRKASALDDFQSFVVMYLQSFGLEVSTESQWINLDVITQQKAKADTHVNQGNLTEERTSMIWPAEYSFCSPLRLYENPDPLEPLFDESSDPIERACAWYIGRIDRAKADEEEEEKREAEAKKKEADMEAARQGATEVIPPIDHRTVIQDPSGVYPTPSDGLQSRGHDTPKNSDAPNQGPTSVEQEQVAFVETPYQYSLQDHGDLFGDNDMGLTEADFEFFDEPGSKIISKKGAEDINSGSEANGPGGTVQKVSQTDEGTASSKSPEQPQTDAPGTSQFRHNLKFLLNLSQRNCQLMQ